MAVKKINVDSKEEIGEKDVPVSPELMRKARTMLESRFSYYEEFVCESETRGIETGYDIGILGGDDLSLEEYSKEVANILLAKVPDKLKKYVGIDQKGMIDMISGTETEDKEWEPAYMDHFDTTVEECWENEVSVTDAVKKFEDGVMELLNGQAGAM